MSLYIESRETEIFAQQENIIRRYGRQAPIIFDVGANTGQSIRRYRAMFPDCRLYSFEPIGDLHASLQATWEDDPDVRIFPLALAAQPGSAEFHITRLREASSLLRPDPLLMSLSRDQKYDYVTTMVTCETLDRFCAAEDVSYIDILKIDVQGAELEVLKGASAMLEAGLIGMVFMEANLAECYEDQPTLREILSFFEGCRYHLSDILPFVYTDSGQAWTANLLFVSPQWLEQITRQARHHGNPNNE